MKQIYSLLLLILLSSKSYSQSSYTLDKSICNNPLRESLKKLPEIKTSSTWFKVYSVGNNVIAIIEPYNFEEAICYLILGKNKALLFDTGIGVENMSSLVKQLTSLPILVLNSHTHYDHIGGNYEFENVLSLNTDFTKKNSNDGWDHEAVKHEVTNEAICLQKTTRLDTANYLIRPYKIARFIVNDDEIDLGNRKLKIISIPGHTPDAIALLDKRNGYLWTGDTYYDGPIYLFAKETNLLDYQNSVEKIAKIAPELKKVFPSHNNPVSDPKRLIELKLAFEIIKNGIAKSKIDEDNAVLFQFQHFGFKINKELLEKIK